jgi:hypothetical protein
MTIRAGVIDEQHQRHDEFLSRQTTRRKIVRILRILRDAAIESDDGPFAHFFARSIG